MRYQVDLESDPLKLIGWINPKRNANSRAHLRHGHIPPLKCNIVEQGAIAGSQLSITRL
jgi:hypothetical protein